MKFNRCFLLVAAAVCAALFVFTPNGTADILINELDSDTPGTDAVEFIELYNTAATPVDLGAGGYVLVLYNGNGDVSYGAYDLTGTIPGNGYFVIGAAIVPNVDLTPSGWPATNAIQNGQDAAALYSATSAVNFPNGTPIRTGNLVDALVYDTADPDDPELIAGLGVNFQIDENSGGDGPNHSIQRYGDGAGGAFDWSSVIVTTPTTGTANPSPSAAPDIARAYSISDTAMVVVFNVDVDQTSAETAGNYSLSDGSNTATFSSAVRGPNDTVTLSGASSTAMMGDTTLDTITATGVQPEGGGTPSNSTKDFYAGISPISNIQQIGISPGYDVTIRGVICANDAYSDVWIADAAGAWNGVLMYRTGTFWSEVDVGDDVTITGQTSEYFTMTQVVSPVVVTKHSTGNTPYGPTVITCADLDNDMGDDHPTAEPYEGVLVTINNAQCLGAQDLNYECLVTDDGNVHQTVIDDDASYHLDFGMSLNNAYNVTGVVMYKYGQYKICPRDASDIVWVSPVEQWQEY